MCQWCQNNCWLSFVGPTVGLLLSCQRQLFTNCANQSPTLAQHWQQSIVRWDAIYIYALLGPNLANRNILFYSVLVRFALETGIRFLVILPYVLFKYRNRIKISISKLAKLYVKFRFSV